MPGGIANEQMILDAKKRITVSRVFDLSTGITAAQRVCLLFDATRPLVITRVSVVFVTETATTSSNVSIGTIATSGALVSVQATSSGAGVIVGTVQKLTLATTLAGFKTGAPQGNPVLPKNTPLMWMHTAASGAGEVQAVIEYFPMDENNTL